MTTPSDQGLHVCAAAGCDSLIPAHLLMCYAHWRLVSQRTQEVVNVAWKRMNRTSAVGDMVAYKEARKAAIAEVGNVRSRPAI